ncbi:MAG: response regulator [Bacteroidales bacterium]|nr:response regulator [Bacteroidales bacterium]MCF8334220.1 response regulator [Bacteroidales bacterium]
MQNFDANALGNMKNRWPDKVVLVAEDVETSNMFYKAALSKTAVTAIWAVTGKQAVEECQSDKQIDLILMDIHMPEMNGLDATRKIKEIRPEVPVVVQTAYLLSNEREKSFDAGADDFLAKPITYQKLMGVLEKFLDK